MNMSLLTLIDGAQGALLRGDPHKARESFYQAAKVLLNEARHCHGDDRRQRLQKIHRILTQCRQLTGGKQPDSDWALMSEQEQMAEAEDMISRQLSFADVVGMAQEKEIIKAKVIDPLRDPEGARLYRRKAGGGVLLYGPPGTGKTFMVKALAGELNAPFYLIKPSDVLSKYVGEPEQKLAAILDEARQHPLAVVFMDEIDAFALKREDSSESASRLLNQLLQEMDGFSTGNQQLLFVGATNLPWDLDEAIVRPGRLSTHIYVGMPDSTARVYMFEKALEGVPTSGVPDMQKLAKASEGYTAAEISGICDRAIDKAYMAYNQQGSIVKLTEDDLLQTIHSQKPQTRHELLNKHREFAGLNNV